MSQDSAIPASRTGFSEVQTPDIGTPATDIVDTLNARFEGASATDILRHVLEDAFKGRIAVVSSFGAEAVVMLHLIAQIDPTTPVLFLNTGKLFGETLRYRDRLQDLLGLTDVRALAPHPDDLKKTDPKGDLWTRDTDGCCHIRKVLPQARAVAPFEALITGRKRFQTGARKAMHIVEHHSDGRYRINPLADWTLDDLKHHIEAHELPRHPLVKDGYLSIGCMPCTERVAAGGDYRSGRWAGDDKDECGIHIDGDGI